MAVDVVAAAAVIGAGASVYSAATAGKGAPNVPKLPDTPKAPDTKAAAASLDQGDIMARTAGGTLLSKPGQPQVGDGANAVRKSLLGQ